MEYEKNQIPVVIATEDTALTPVYSSECAAGADLRSSEDVIIPAGERVLVKTGVSVIIPNGYVGLIHPRSGLALKHGITVLNTPGTIDSDYRGEIGVILYNTSKQDFSVVVGDRIAQIVFQPYVEAKFINAGVELPKDTRTTRGVGGFGSTGVGGL